MVESSGGGGGDGLMVLWLSAEWYVLIFLAGFQLHTFRARALQVERALNLYGIIFVFQI